VSALSQNAREVSASAFDLAGKRVFVAGHTGMAGSAIVRRLQQEPCTILVAERRELDLTRQDQAEHYLSASKPDVVIIASGTVMPTSATSTELSRTYRQVS
jgi:GDP-L-fucose synthase